MQLGLNIVGQYRKLVLAIIFHKASTLVGSIQSGTQKRMMAYESVLSFVYIPSVNLLAKIISLTS